MEGGHDAILSCAPLAYIMRAMSEFEPICLERQSVLQSYIKKNGIEAYRLLHYGACEFPIAVDLYKDCAVMHCTAGLEAGPLEEIERGLHRAVGAKFFFYKNRSGREIELPKSSHKELTISEYGNIFLVNAADYLDTGIFLDHRETRKWIAAQSKGKTLLNLFAYTGAFSVYAARGGARLTHSVDLSKTYCEWMKKNFELNAMAPEHNWVLKMDVREYFKYAHRKRLQFDIIIIDPPTFSRNKGVSFSVQKDHPELINRALELLSPKGFILFSNNFSDFALREDKLAPCKVEEKMDTIPPDFEGSVPHLCYIIKSRA